jgi:N-acetylglutamate synthase
MDGVRAAETCLCAIWPAGITVPLAGWMLRAGTGGYNRTNSVWPVGFDGATPVEAAIEAAELFYADRGLPCRFQLLDFAEPAGLDTALARRGYVRGGFRLTMVKPLGRAAKNHGQATLTDGPTADWLGVYMSEQDATRASECLDILGRLPPTPAFVTVKSDGLPAAVGLGIRWKNDVAVECILTRRDGRRAGAATVVIQTIEAWAARMHAARLVLTVIADNTAAVGLYGKLGFRAIGRYHYRTLALEGNGGAST